MDDKVATQRISGISTPILDLSSSRLPPRPDRLYTNLVSRSALSVESEEMLKVIVDEYGIRLLGILNPPGAPGRSDRFIIDTSAGKKFLKGYKRNYKPMAVEHEHSIIKHLAEVNFPAPRLTCTASGETFIQRNGRCYAMFEYLDGYYQYNNYITLPWQTRQFIAAAGEALAALHNALYSFTPIGHNPNGFVSRTEGRLRELNWFTEKLNWCLEQLPQMQTEGTRFMRNMLADNALWVEERLRFLDATLGAVGLPRLIIHGDYGPFNLLFKRALPVVIVDFELARLDWRLVDLARAFGYFAQSRIGFSFRKAEIFLSAYRSSFPVDDGEQQLLPVVWEFLSLRRLIVCWHRYCGTYERQWEREAKRKLALARWLNNEKVITRLVNSLS